MQPGFFKLKVKRHTIKNRWKSVKFKSKIQSFLAYTMASLTGHKVQGATLHSIIIGPWGCYKHGADGWVNVILSRVRDLAILYILEKLPEDPKLYKKRVEVAAENSRIKYLSDLTFEKLDTFLT